MVDPATTRKLLFQLMFLSVCFLVIFIKMLPLGTEPSAIPAPDLIFAFTACFVIRRPRYAPVGLIIFVHLIADMLFLRPMGLWPAITLLAYEYLRHKETDQTDLELSVELLLVPAVFAIAMGANSLVYFTLDIVHPSLGQTLLHVLMTAVAYPFVIGVTEFILGVRRVRPGEIEADGSTL